MANKGYTVSGLTAYVEENKDVILRDAILGGVYGDTIANLTKQVGVKTSERLHPMVINPVLQAAEACGFTPSGSTVISERLLSTAQIKYNDEFCADDLLGKFAEYKVRVGANEDALPFEAEITDGVVKGINKQLEKLVWQGNKSNGDLFDGFLTIAEGADAASTVTGATAAGASAYAAVKQAYMAIPEEMLEKAVIFVSPAIFREYVQDLVDANLYHYNPADGDLSEMFIPGASVKVRKAQGLAGSSKIYASTWENMVYGCDLVDGNEEIKAWFSDDNDTYRMKVRFNAGVTTVLPDAVVVITKA